jgi:predicted nucleic-acid-binding protein
MKRVLVDTNLIVRYLVQDNERQARAAEQIFGACDDGLVIAEVLPVVLAECVFVLESFYEHARADIADALTRLITSPGIEIEASALHVDALHRYATTSVHFIDCSLAATAADKNKAVATFDKGFRKFRDVRTYAEEADD